MNDPKVPETGQAGGDREDILSVLFAQMIAQQSNMALMLLGKIPHPDSGKTMRDVDGARMFIDQLEMLEAKTRGNLSREEEQLLKHSLMSLRLAFVEAVESAPAESAPAPAPSAPASAPGATGESIDPTGAEEAGKKKFSKKY